MKREDAIKLIGIRRVYPGVKTTIHECIRITGNCSVDANGYHEDYSQAWMTAYEPGDIMWTSIDAFVLWSLAEAGSVTETEKRRKERDED